MDCSRWYVSTPRLGMEESIYKLFYKQVIKKKNNYRQAIMIGIYTFLCSLFIIYSYMVGINLLLMIISIMIFMLFSQHISDYIGLKYLSYTKTVDDKELIYEP